MAFVDEIDIYWAVLAFGERTDEQYIASVLLLSDEVLSYEAETYAKRNHRNITLIALSFVIAHRINYGESYLLPCSLQKKILITMLSMWFSFQFHLIFCQNVVILLWKFRVIITTSCVQIYYRLEGDNHRVSSENEEIENQIKYQLRRNRLWMTIQLIPDSNQIDFLFISIEMCKQHRFTYELLLHPHRILSICIEP